MPAVTALPEGPATIRDRVALELLARRSLQARRDILDKARRDPVWWIDYFCDTFDPRPDVEHHEQPFFLYDFQREMVRWLQDRLSRPADGLVEKSRDMGATWVVLAFLLHQWLFESGFSALVGSRKEELVDNRTRDSLFGRLDFMLERLPGWMLPKGFNWDKHRFERRLVNPENQNIIIGESANAQFSRQGRHTIIVMDEGAFWPDFESAWRAAGSATRSRVVISTPNGMEAFGRLRHSGKIDVLTLHWRLHPHKDDGWYESERARMTDVDVAQELDISYSRSVSGVVYPFWKDVPRGHYGYQEGWPLYVSIDFGLADPTAILWAQRNPQTGRVRLLECYANNGKPADFYIPLITGEIPGGWHYSYSPREHAMISRHAVWGQPVVFGDPAGNQRAQTSGVSIIDIYRAHGLHVVTKPEAQRFKERFTRTQMLLPDLEVNLVEDSDIDDCAELDEAILNARFPERGADATTTSEILKPIHNWTSHYRSALEYLAVNLPRRRMGLRRRPAPVRARYVYEV